jgi:hypothetical protein
MTNFYGYEIELFGTDILTESQGFCVRTGLDSRGGQWLIVLVEDDPDHLVWICAPVSARAISELAAGRAAVTDVVRHSLTGTVEFVTVKQGRAVPDSCRLCSDIPAALLPPSDFPVALAA